MEKIVPLMPTIAIVFAEAALQVSGYQNTFLSVLLAVLAVVSLIFPGYYYWSQWRANRRTVKTTEASAPTTQRLSIALPNGIDSFLVYRITHPTTGRKTKMLRIAVVNNSELDAVSVDLLVESVVDEKGTEYLYRSSRLRHEYDGHGGTIKLVAHDKVRFDVVADDQSPEATLFIPTVGHELRVPIKDGPYTMKIKVTGAGPILYQSLKVFVDDDGVLRLE